MKPLPPTSLFNTLDDRVAENQTERRTGNVVSSVGILNQAVALVGKVSLQRKYKARSLPVIAHGAA